MGWFGKKVAKFRQVPDPYFSLHVTAKFLAGVGIGVLLATWLQYGLAGYLLALLC